MKYAVENPTYKSKAVREAGGLTIIKPGETKSVEAEWTNAEIERYEKAGCVIKKGSAAKKAEA